MSNDATTLHNHLQEKGEAHLISYSYSSVGPSNQITWTAECKIAGVVRGIGEGTSKIEAKQIAAGQALKALGLN